MYKDLDLVGIFQAGEPGLVALVRPVLEGSDIQFVVKGEDLQDLFGLGRLYGGFKSVVGAVEFQVRRSDLEVASALLKELSPHDAGAS